MNKSERKVSAKRKWGSIVIAIFCMVISVCVIADLLLFYEPSQNALGALGTVCMDVISMSVLIIFIINLTYERKGINITTQLFLGLMLATLYALFFDFLNWSFDGSLQYSSWTYVFTCSSLVMGSVLAAILCFYLSNYVDDMYGMKGAYLNAKICLALNIVAFIMTFILAITKTAFVFVDGHYKPGPYYDAVTVIPVLTILYMSGYLIINVKKIGLHDTIAVVGYIFIMVAGAVIEALFGIGATYISVAIADVFIFLMLQNNYLDRLRKQREKLAENLASQYEILESMAGIYSYVNNIDLEEMTARRFDIADEGEQLDLVAEPHSGLNTGIYQGIDDEFKEKFWAYTDLSTLPDRMGNEKIISAEFHHKEEGWIRAQYIRIGDTDGEPLRKVIYAIQNIDEEKKNVEKWIRKSNTDELTGYYNRNAYEDELTALETSGLKDNFVYVSIDVNSLKVANDTLGHDAGDELIIGSCECIKQCLGSYGKLYRIGGDEFAALIYADEAQLAKIIRDLEEVTEKWQGKLNKQLAISCGYAACKENPGMTIHELAILADKKMYEDKAKYYREKGIDRRGQRDAHVALCALYTKILKINITDDTYQIINMNVDEQSDDKGFADTISGWLYEFGVSGQVYSDDIESYQTKTSMKYLSDYFHNHKEALHIFYRRKIDDEYKPVMMEIIPANDYSDDSQSLYLYVKNIEQ